MIFCPSLASTGQEDAVEPSSHGAGSANKPLRLLVCAWAGKSVEEQVTHGPFNLMLRLAVELTNGVVVPVGKAAAEELDDMFTPFQSNHGVVQAFAVQKQTATNTVVTVCCTCFHGARVHFAKFLSSLCWIR